MLLCATSTITPTQNTLERMSEVGHQFQLTGSRFFGTDTSFSDWDFFTQDCPGVRLWLKTNGFTMYDGGSGYAGDGQCVNVYVFNDGRDPEDMSHQIHVQVVKDFDLKQTVQKLLLSLYGPELFPTDKQLVKSIWKHAFMFHMLGFNTGYQIGVANGCELTRLAHS